MGRSSCAVAMHDQPKARSLPPHLGRRISKLALNVIPLGAFAFGAFVDGVVFRHGVGFPWRGSGSGRGSRVALRLLWSKISPI